MRRAKTSGMAVAAASAGAFAAVTLATALAFAALPPKLSADVAKLPPALQQQLRAREVRLGAMTPEQQQSLRQRVAAWDALPVTQLRARRERWQAWQALPPHERWQLQTAARQFAALPMEQQQQLRARFAQLDGSERHGWLLGPTLGADYPGLQPLLMQVPEAERDSLLQILRAMTPAQRLDLAILAQRSPPQQRDALRRELLSTAAANREAWLRSRLER